MDGPSINWKFLEVFQQDRKEKCLSQLVNIGSCGLHTVHGAFKTIDWDLKKIMKAGFT